MNEDPNWLYHDHLDLEDLLEAAADATRQQNWDIDEHLFGKLVDRLKGHMRIEEQEVLLPAYEQVPGAAAQPTEAFCRDHDAIVNWCRDLHYATRARHPVAFFGSLQTLRELLAAHDEKEEYFFLPMAGHSLAQDKAAILERLKAPDFTTPDPTRHNWGF
jgi:iron-sulfur cluster repair protein YtfE (RIC family)